MSTSSQGPGWWQASDGRWYPPELHPSATPPAVPAPSPVPGGQEPPSVGGWDVPPDGHPDARGTVPDAPPASPPPGPPGPPGAPPSWGPQAPPYAPPVPHAPPQPAPYGQPGPPAGFSSPSSGRPGFRWGPLVAVAVVVALLLVGAVAWLVASGGDDGGSYAPLIESEGDTDIVDLALGDCFDDPTLDSPDLVEVGYVDSVPCEEPHDAEVYAVVDVPRGTDDRYPGDDQVADVADSLCFEPFEEYVGVSYEDSTLDFLSYTPTEESWSAGDRVVACVLLDYEGQQLTGSMRGSGR